MECCQTASCCSSAAKPFQVKPHWIYDRIRNGTIHVAKNAIDKTYLFPDTPETHQAIQKSCCVLIYNNANILKGHRDETSKSDCLERMILFGERAVRNAVREFVAHYVEERNHQGWANEIFRPGDNTGLGNCEIQIRERHGGILKYYHRQTAQLRASARGPGTERGRCV